MRAKTVIHLISGKPVKTAVDTEGVLRSMERLQLDGTLLVQCLTDHGTEKRCFLPRPTILRVEEL